jgi:hypothetical protein
MLPNPVMHISIIRIIVDKIINDTINEGNALRSININSDFGIEQNSGLQGCRNLIIRR